MSETKNQVKENEAPLPASGKHTSARGNTTKSHELKADTIEQVPTNEITEDGGNGTSPVANEAAVNEAAAKEAADKEAAANEEEPGCLNVITECPPVFYRCMAEGCGFKTRSFAKLKTHEIAKHDTAHGYEEWLEQQEEGENGESRNTPRKASPWIGWAVIDDSKWYYCEECSFRSMESQKYDEHVAITHGKTLRQEIYYYCPVEGCDFKVKRSSSLQVHIDAQHPPPPPKRGRTPPLRRKRLTPVQAKSISVKPIQNKKPLLKQKNTKPKLFKKPPIKQSTGKSKRGSKKVTDSDADEEESDSDGDVDKDAVSQSCVVVEEAAKEQDSHQTAAKEQDSHQSAAKKQSPKKAVSKKQQSPKKSAAKQRVPKSPKSPLKGWKGWAAVDPDAPHHKCTSCDFESTSEAVFESHVSLSHGTSLNLGEIPPVSSSRDDTDVMSETISIARDIAKQALPNYEKKRKVAQTKTLPSTKRAKYEEDSYDDDDDSSEEGEDIEENDEDVDDNQCVFAENEGEGFGDATHGKNVNEQIYTAVRQNDLKLAKDLLQKKDADINYTHEDGWNLIHSAVEASHLQMVKLLIEHEARVNVMDNDQTTPLLLGVQNMNLDMVRLLVESGADVHISNSSGWSPVHQAAESCSVEIIRLLLERGANVNQADNRMWTPLMVAIAERGEDATYAELLSQHGANVNHCDRDHMTPLILAAQRGHAETVKSLMLFGADLHARGGVKEQTALEAAIDGGHEAAKTVLEKLASERDATDAALLPEEASEGDMPSTQAFMVSKIPSAAASLTIGGVA